MAITCHSTSRSKVMILIRNIETLNPKKPDIPNLDSYPQTPLTRIRLQSGNCLLDAESLAASFGLVALRYQDLLMPLQRTLMVQNGVIGAEWRMEGSWGVAPSHHS